MYVKIANFCKCIGSVEVESTPELLCNIILQIDEYFQYINN